MSSTEELKVDRCANNPSLFFVLNPGYSKVMTVVEVGWNALKKDPSKLITLLLYGQPATGKTTLANILLHKFGLDPESQHVLFIPGINYSTIDARDRFERDVRTHIEMSQSIRQKDGKWPVMSTVLFIEKADELHPTVLRYINGMMDKLVCSTKPRFPWLIMTANFGRNIESELKLKVDDSGVSRFRNCWVEFPPLNRNEMIRILQEHNRHLPQPVTPSVIPEIVDQRKPTDDIRRLVNLLTEQSFSNRSTFTCLSELQFNFDDHSMSKSSPPSDNDKKSDDSKNGTPPTSTADIKSNHGRAPKKDVTNDEIINPFKPGARENDKKIARELLEEMLLQGDTRAISVDEKAAIANILQKMGKNDLSLIQFIYRIPLTGEAFIVQVHNILNKHIRPTLKEVFKTDKEIENMPKKDQRKYAKKGCWKATTTWRVILVKLHRFQIDKEWARKSAEENQTKSPSFITTDDFKVAGIARESGYLLRYRDGYWQNQILILPDSQERIAYMLKEGWDRIIHTLKGPILYDCNIKKKKVEDVPPPAPPPPTPPLSVSGVLGQGSARPEDKYIDQPLPESVKWAAPTLSSQHHKCHNTRASPPPPFGRPLQSAPTPVRQTSSPPNK
jgi:hypothetical protein